MMIRRNQSWKKWKKRAYTIKISINAGQLDIKTMASIRAIAQQEVVDQVEEFDHRATYNFIPVVVVHIWEFSGWVQSAMGLFSSFVYHTNVS